MTSLFRMRAPIVALAIAGLRFAGPASDATAAALPKDPCAFLKPADIQALAPNAKIGSGVLNANPPLAVACTYRWGPRASEWGQTEFSVTVVDASQVWPAGLSSSDIRQRVLVEVKIGGPDASEIPGIGDGGVFTTTPKVNNATAKAYLLKTKASSWRWHFTEATRSHTRTNSSRFEGRSSGAPMIRLFVALSTLRHRLRNRQRVETDPSDRAGRTAAASSEAAMPPLVVAPRPNAERLRIAIRETLRAPRSKGIDRDYRRGDRAGREDAERLRVVPERRRAAAKEHGQRALDAAEADRPGAEVGE